MFLAAALIGVEAVVAIGYAVIEITHIAPGRFVVGAGVTLLLGGYGAFLVAISRGVRKGRRWSRGAAVATQLMQLLLAYSFRQGQTWWVGLALGSVAVVVLVCVFTPAATAIFTAEPVPLQDESTDELAAEDPPVER